MAIDPSMVYFLCPKCDMKLMNRNPQSEVDCPNCAQKIIVPFPLSATANRTVLGKPLSPSTDAIAAIDLPRGSEIPVAKIDDGYEEHRPSRSVRRRPRGFECVHCGSTEKPELRKEMDPLGWVIFAIAFLVPPFFLVCWLGFFFRSTYEVCYECGRKGQKIDGPNFSFK